MPVPKPVFDFLQRLHSNRLTCLVVICTLLPVGIVSAQETWWVQSADYGYGKQRADVTATVRRLADGPNFKVNNTNLGVDPAPGKDKTLHIVAKDAKGKVKEFTYNERTVVPAAMFAGGAGPAGAANPASGARSEMRAGEGRLLRINEARWGATGKWKDVTEHVQSMASNNRIYTKVDAKTMGVDPAPGHKKELIVEYLYQGKSGKTTVPEGGILHIP